MKRSNWEANTSATASSVAARGVAHTSQARSDNGTEGRGHSADLHLAGSAQNAMPSQ